MTQSVIRTNSSEGGYFVVLNNENTTYRGSGDESRGELSPYRLRIRRMTKAASVVTPIWMKAVRRRTLSHPVPASLAGLVVPALVIGAFGLARLRRYPVTA
jgi:hypothetical protein